jgi:hypothetical protein
MTDEEAEALLPEYLRAMLQDIRKEKNEWREEIKAGRVKAFTKEGRELSVEESLELAGVA